MYEAIMYSVADPDNPFGGGGVVIVCGRRRRPPMASKCWRGVLYKLRTVACPEKLEGGGGGGTN